MGGRAAGTFGGSSLARAAFALALAGTTRRTATFLHPLARLRLAALLGEPLLHALMPALHAAIVGTAS